MQNIGERLEEARKRLGVSIREASEATKIRGDYLVAFETGSSDIPLPEIYRRGFLKIYARYLKLDTDKIMNDYTAVQLGNSRLARKEGREFFGRMDLPPEEGGAPGRGEEAERPDNGGSRSPVPPPEPGRFEKQRRAAGPTEDDREQTSWKSSDDGPNLLYWKVGLGALGGFVLVFLIIAFVQVITGGDVEPIDRDVAADRTTDTGTAGNAGNPGTSASGADDSAGLATEELTLTARGGPCFVQVREQASGETVFMGTLIEGESQTVSIRGEAIITYTQGSNLIFSINGVRSRPDPAGGETASVSTADLPRG
ncbi:MAG: helix-turn-helix domain-containing protein [Opitutales bacterium]